VPVAPISGGNGVPFLVSAGIVYEIIAAAFRHKGFSFVRILQRCPEWLPNLYEPWMKDPQKMRILTHERGVRISASLAKVYKNQEAHEPSDLNRARQIASLTDEVPVGILYHNPDVPCYEDLRGAGQLRSSRFIKRGLEAELDKFTVWPEQWEERVPPAD